MAVAGVYGSRTARFARVREWVTIAASSFALSACATAAPHEPINAPLSAPPQPAPAAAPLEGDVLALALSGGGARAAAFSLGVLQELRATPGADGRSILDHTALVTSVSGGSIMAAHFGLHGSAGLDSFRAAYLDKDWHEELRSPYWPGNWAAAARGGLNDDRALANWLDAEIFEGATIADFRGPRVVLNAADLYNGVPFPFTSLTFDALCSDLASVRVADAVAASMAVPLYFHSLLIEPHTQNCPPLPAWVGAAARDRSMSALQRATARALNAYRDETQQPYVHLVDGGVIDNLGLSALTLERQAAASPLAPLSEADAVRVNSITILVVNSEKIRQDDWPAEADGPTATQTLDTVFDLAIELGNRAAYDSFRAEMARWQDHLRTWRCNLSLARAAELGAGEGWRCDALTIRADMIGFADLPPDQRDRLGAEPTRVSLPAAEIDALIEGGRHAARANPAVQALAGNR